MLILHIIFLHLQADRIQKILLLQLADILPILRISQLADTAGQVVGSIAVGVVRILQSIGLGTDGGAAALYGLKGFVDRLQIKAAGHVKILDPEICQCGIAEVYVLARAAHIHSNGYLVSAAVKQVFLIIIGHLYVL